MLSQVRIGVAAMMFWASCLCAGAAVAQDADIFASRIQPLPPAELLALLRGGGNVIYFRHAATVAGADKGTTDLDDCTTQRNLSEEGRADARRIGDAFRHFNIPLGEVLASPYCRTMDTARLAFGRVEKSIQLFSRGKSLEPDELTRTEWLRQRLGSAPAAGVNTVLVSHGSPLDAVAKEFLREGEAAVARPAGDGSFRLIARVRPDEWERLGVER